MSFSLDIRHHVKLDKIEEIEVLKGLRKPEPVSAQGKLARMKFALRKNFVLTLLLAGMTQWCVGAAYSFGSDETGNIHEQLTMEALKGTICDANLKLILKGVSAADFAGGEGANDPRRHFKTGEITKCIAVVDREKKKVLNFAHTADTDEKTRARALFIFGQALHTLQDFYSRSNYIELREHQFKDDLFSMDLADWTDMQRAESKIGTLLKFEGFDKSTPTSEEGKKSISGTTYYKVARELALRETQRQWNLMETLIRNKTEKRANEVITAITSAPCSVKANEILNDEKPDLVPDL